MRVNRATAGRSGGSPDDYSTASRARWQRARLQTATTTLADSSASSSRKRSSASGQSSRQRPSGAFSNSAPYDSDVRAEGEQARFAFDGKNALHPR